MFSFSAAMAYGLSLPQIEIKSSILHVASICEKIMWDKNTPQRCNDLMMNNIETTVERNYKEGACSKILK